MSGLGRSLAHTNQKGDPFFCDVVALPTRRTLTPTDFPDLSLTRRDPDFWLIMVMIIKITWLWSTYYSTPSPTLSLYNNPQCNHYKKKKKSYQEDPIATTILQMRKLRPKVVKYLFKVTKLVNGREFKPSSFVFRPSALGRSYVTVPPFFRDKPMTPVFYWRGPNDIF